MIFNLSTETFAAMERTGLKMVLIGESSFVSFIRLVQL